MLFYREESHINLRKREAAELRKAWIRSAPAEKFKMQLRSRLKNRHDIPTRKPDAE